MADTNANLSAETIRLLRGLRQVRRFRPDPVPAAALADILEVGRWTGSGMNQQPWEFIVVQNPATLQAIVADEAQNSWLGTVPCAIIIRMTSEYPEILAYDEGRLTERLMLAAAAHGLGAGIWWFKDGGAAARQHLGIPEGGKVRTAVAVGYPAADGVTKRGEGRKPLSELVHNERY
jgi:nitroreductase